MTVTVDCQVSREQEDFCGAHFRKHRQTSLVMKFVADIVQ